MKKTIYLILLLSTVLSPSLVIAETGEPQWQDLHSSWNRLISSEVPTRQQYEDLKRKVASGSLFSIKPPSPEEKNTIAWLLREITPRITGDSFYLTFRSASLNVRCS